MKSIKNMIKHLKNGNVLYVISRLREIFIPVPNPIFYWDFFVMIKGVPENKQIPRARGSCKSVISYATTNEDFNALFEQFPYHSYNHERRNEKDALCIMARTPGSGRINGYTWLKFSDGQPFVTNVGMEVSFPEQKAAWGYGFYVIPECRLSSVFLLLAQEIRKVCEKEGATALYSETAINNVRSIRSFAKVGKHVYEKVMVISIFGFKVFLAKQVNGGIKLRFKYVPKTHQVLAIKDA